MLTNTDSLYVLCDDGTLWINNWDEGELQEWERLKEIPQGLKVLLAGKRAKGSVIFKNAFWAAERHIF